MSHQKILILDFGSQVAQLIARRVREQQVYCEMHPFDVSEEFIREFKPQGIILSGGPNSVYEAAEWQPVPPDQFAASELCLQPHVILLTLPVPADRCEEWEDFQPGEDESIHLAVWRGDHGGASECRLDPVELVLLTRLRKGGTLASLFEEPTDREPTPEEVSNWFTNWQSRRWIALPPAAETDDFPLVPHREVRDIDWDRIDKMGSQARAMED